MSTDGARIHALAEKARRLTMIHETLLQKCFVCDAVDDTVRVVEDLLTCTGVVVCAAHFVDAHRAMYMRQCRQQCLAVHVDVADDATNTTNTADDASDYAADDDDAQDSRVPIEFVRRPGVMQKAHICRLSHLLRRDGNLYLRCTWPEEHDNDGRRPSLREYRRWVKLADLRPADDRALRIRSFWDSCPALAQDWGVGQDTDAWLA